MLRLIRLDKRVYDWILFLVLFDTISTYLCILFYPLELEFNLFLRFLLKSYGVLSLLLYAPLEYFALLLLITTYNWVLLKLGVKDTWRYCKIVLVFLALPVALNWIGVLIGVLKAYLW